MIIAEFIVLPVFFILNNLSFDQRFLAIAGISILGTLGMAAVGTILSTISANTRMKEVMLPILQIPLTVPVVIAAAEATSQILNKETPEISAWLTILGGFSIVYLVVSYLVFEFAVEE
jgi:heme exporter protein B